MSSVLALEEPAMRGPRRTRPSPANTKLRPGARRDSGVRPILSVIVVTGLLFRLLQYLRDPSMWHDEAALVLNVIGKSFRELLGPLYWSEAAPPLFLWLERGVALVLGDGTLALRLVPFLAGCATLLLLVPLARRVVSPAAVPWAVLLIATADRLVWHSCEAKPYAVDVFAAVLLPWLFCVTDNWTAVWRFGLFTVLAPLVVFLSFPGCFLYGGLLLAAVPEIWPHQLVAAENRTRRRAALAYGVLILVVFVSFSILLFGPIHAQRCDPLQQCWQTTFPPWERPWAVPAWAAWSSMEIVDYCFRPAGGTLALLAAVGAVRLWRRGARRLVCLLAAPILLALVAALGRAYPYTGARVMAYAGPAFALFIAEGGVATLGWLRRRWQKSEPRAMTFQGHAARAGFALVTLALLAPLGLSLYRLAFPWPRPDFTAATGYVIAHRRPGDFLTGNSWESLYYFRHQPEALVPLGERVRPDAERVWVVVTGSVPAEAKRQIADHLAPPGWQTLERREFYDILVLLKARANDD